jgi:hypothetical protein
MKSAPKIVAVVKRNETGQLILCGESRVGPGDDVTFIAVQTGVVAVLVELREGDLEVIENLLSVS